MTGKTSSFDEFQIILLESGIRETFPFRFGFGRFTVLFWCFEEKGMRCLCLSKLKCKIKLVVWISCNLKRFFLEPLGFQETGHLSVFGVWNIWKEYICGIEVASHDSCLVLKDSEHDLVRNNVQGFVDEVDSVFLCQVSKHSVLGLPSGRSFKVHKSLDLSSNTVVQTSSIVNVNETISNPFSGRNLIVDLIKQFERSFDSSLWTNLSHSNGLRYLLSIVTQDVRRVFGGEQHHVAAVTPIDVFRNGFNFLDECTRVPVIEQNSIGSFYPNCSSTEETIRACRCRNNCLTFLKVLEGFDRVRRFTDAVVSSSATRPNKIESLSECFVSQGL